MRGITTVMPALKNKIISALGRNALKLEGMQPQILGVVGIACLVGGTVAACRATLKSHERLEAAHELCASITEEAHRPIPIVEHVTENAEGALYVYDPIDETKQKAIVLTRAGSDVARFFVPAIALEAVGIACIVKSQSLFAQRIAALSAAYITLENSYNQYRMRVIEKDGAEVDRQYRLGLREEEVEVSDEETGLSKTEVIETYHAGNQPYTKYSRYFDEYNTSMYRTNPEENFTFLRLAQSRCNEILSRKKWLTLNEVYYELGFDPIPEGQIVGWLFEPGNYNKVDFGIWEARNADARDYVYGRNTCFVLDFNLDGVIWDKI